MKTAKEYFKEQYSSTHIKDVVNMNDFKSLYALIEEYANQPTQSTEEVEGKLKNIMSVLDDFLGDTDPYIDEDMTDDDICQEEPIFWAHTKLCELLDNKQNLPLLTPQPEQPTKQVSESAIFEIIQAQFPDYNVPYCTEVAEAIRSLYSGDTEQYDTGDTAWPFKDVLDKLILMADILLHKKDYDGHGWEELERCYQLAKNIKQPPSPSLP